MGMPQVEQLHTTFSSSPVGFTEERAGEKQPDSAFDSVRPEMHAQYLECWAANRMIQLNRKQEIQCSLSTAIAAASSQPPCC